jgi:hypothetical protein
MTKSRYTDTQIVNILKQIIMNDHILQENDKFHEK